MWFSTKKEAIKRYTNNHLPRPRSRQTSRIPPYLQIPDQSTSHIALAYRRAICLVITCWLSFRKLASVGVKALLNL